VDVNPGTPGKSGTAVPPTPNLISSPFERILTVTDPDLIPGSFLRSAVAMNLKPAPSE